MKNCLTLWHKDAKKDLSLFQGELPPRVLGLVIEWAEFHKNESLEDWNMVQKTGRWFKIEPLV
jgi:hypothetical protein